MKQYLALLRGVNVGGHAMLSMPELREALTGLGFGDVRSYIQSGNVFFAAESAPAAVLAQKIRGCIQQKFGLMVGVVVFTQSEWQAVIRAAPQWWGKDAAYKHNLLAVLPPHEASEVTAAAGELKPGVEAMQTGPHGVVYQSLSRELFGRTTASKLISNPIYKQLTIRNFNTAHKLLKLFQQG